MYTAQFWNVLKDRIEKRIAHEEKALGAGNSSSYEHYKHRVGMIEGMNFCISEARDIMGDEADGRRRKEQSDADQE